MTSHRFEVGDHLSSPRTLYTHHGIYLGQDLVIHYTGFASDMSAGAIDITTLDDFTQGHGARSIQHPDRKWNVDETIARAYERLGEDWYNLLFNNCEHFVYWCIEGRHESPQVNRCVAYTMSALTHAAVSRQAPRLLAVLMSRYGIGTIGTPVARTVATSLMSSTVAPGLTPALAKAVTNGVVTAGAASTTSYGAAAALAGIAGLTAPISLPTALVAGAAVGLGSYLYNKIFD